MALDCIVSVVGVAGRLYCIVLGRGVSCCCVSVTVVAVVMLQLCLFLIVAVTGYRDWVIQVILIRTNETKTTIHIQLVVVKAFELIL